MRFTDLIIQDPDSHGEYNYTAKTAYVFCLNIAFYNKPTTRNPKERKGSTDAKELDTHRPFLNPEQN